MHRCGSDAVTKVPLADTPDSWIRYEAVFINAVRAVGAPAPRVLDVVEHDGRAVSVYERVEGPSMWEYIREHPGEAAAMGRLLADVHAEITRLTAPMIVPRQRDRLSCKIRRAASEVAAELIHALDLLHAEPDSSRLCHGDIHPGNVIMANDGPILVDWFDACRGEPAGDVTRGSLLMGAAGATTDSITHLPGARRDVLLRLHEAYIESMMDQLQLGWQSFHRWRRIEAAARLAEDLAATELLGIWRDVERQGPGQTGT